MKVWNLKIFFLIILFFPVNFIFAATSTDDFNVSIEVITSTESTPEQGGGGSGQQPVITPIEISGINTQNISTSSASIIFSTNLQAICELRWGEDNSYGNVLLESSSQLNHSFSLQNLLPKTDYYFSIYCSNSDGSAQSSGYQFSTLENPDIIPPQNVSGFKTVKTDSGMELSWGNPTDLDFQGVIVRRSDVFFPTDKNQGILVYQGKDAIFLDTGLQEGKTYYYAVFSYDGVPNYSSGAIASGFFFKEEEKIEPEEEKTEISIGGVDTSGGRSTSTLQDLIPKKDLQKEWQEKIDKISIEDISITQNGKNIIDTKDKIIRSDQPLDVKFDCSQLPPFVKVIVLSLGKDGKETSFVLCSEGKGNEMATMPPKEQGKYSLTILFLDYQNQVVKKIDTEIQILPPTFLKPPRELAWYEKIIFAIGSVWVLWWGKLLIVTSIVLLALLIAFFRQQEQNKFFEKFKRRRIEID
ncbi:MAG TPA: fibronectin type III domain-containing protein [Candidatus Pacearchaeota archaeon]|nr:fibronectin type III domain-containing protein [Candidatus Pacearchaeota archaeon]